MTLAGPTLGNLGQQTAGLALGCIKVYSVGNKLATLCHTTADERLDVLVIIETWHENSGLVTAQESDATWLSVH